MYYTMTFLGNAEESILNYLPLELSQAIVKVKSPHTGLETYMVQEMVCTFVEPQKKT